MNVFEAVKQSVTTRQAAEHYGIHVGRNGMACCPFHILLFEKQARFTDFQAVGSIASTGEQLFIRSFPPSKCRKAVHSIFAFCRMFCYTGAIKTKESDHRYGTCVIRRTAGKTE